MDCESNAETCLVNPSNEAENKLEDGKPPEGQDVAEKSPLDYLTGSELFMLRKEMCDKTKDNDMEFSVGPKQYVPDGSTPEKENMEAFSENQKRSLSLQRGARQRDLMKAEWNEELKVATMQSLKGKCTQHMGRNLKGKIALSPEEALFLLEKNCIEIKRNNMIMSIEEAYSVMLKERLKHEKYRVYSFLSQQGFIVVQHQSRIGPSYEQIMNLKKKKQKQKKRKGTSEASEEPERKRLTFTGVLASNSEINSFVNAESSTLSSDCEILSNTESQNKVDSVSKDVFHKNDDNAAIELQNNNKPESAEILGVSVCPDSTNRVDSSDSTEKNAGMMCNKEPTNSVARSTSEDQVRSQITETTASDIVVSQDKDVSMKQEQNIKDATEAVKCVDVDEDKNEIEVENDDTSEVIIDDVENSDGNEDINVDEESLNTFYDNDEYDSFQEGDSVMCEESSEDGSVDVLSCSTSDQQSVLDDFNSASINYRGGPSKEHDDEVTLVEVKKKENKPLAVIDLLSDEEQGDKNNDKESYEVGSDDDIQVVKVCQTTNKNQSLRQSFVKSEYKKEKDSIDCTNIKSSFHQQMKFPDLFKKDILCLARPPANLLPNHVRPAKEAYVIHHRTNIQANKQPRVWNSFRDLQEYQREKRRERQMGNNANFRPFGYRDPRHQNDSYSSRMSPFNNHENSRDVRFDRGSQNYSNGNILNSPVPFNHNDRNPVPPSPDVFNPANHMPFMNMSHLQNLSSVSHAAFVNEIHKTVYSVTSSMLSSMLGSHINPPARSSPTFHEPPMMGFGHHQQFNNFQDRMALNTDIRTDMHPVRFPPDPVFSGDRYLHPVNSGPMPENNWRPMNNIRQKNFPRGPLFPCPYREVRKKRNWGDVKAATQRTNNDASDSGSDIEEVPINLNQFLWSNDIQPLVKPGSKLPVSDVLKSLQITQMAELKDEKKNIDRYLPGTPTLEISFDVYLPGSKYKKTEPDVPKYRIIVVRSDDPIPKHSEIVLLQRKWNDGASLQIAVVDNGDISFYSFTGINVPEIVPHKR